MADAAAHADNHDEGYGSPPPGPARDAWLRRGVRAAENFGEAMYALGEYLTYATDGSDAAYQEWLAGWSESLSLVEFAAFVVFGYSDKEVTRMVKALCAYAERWPGFFCDGPVREYRWAARIMQKDANPATEARRWARRWTPARCCRPSPRRRPQPP
eukprot:SM010555S14112  [mRNA]  locus=s10555:10:490:- [translate_table: standard]